MEDFDARSFYKQHLKQEEDDFKRETGLTIRREFQSWKSGSDNDEVFVVKSPSKKECFGLEYAGFICYFIPQNADEALLLIFDQELMELMEELSELTQNEYAVFKKYIPSLAGGLMSSSVGNFRNYCIWATEGMACLAKQVPFSLQRLVNDDGAIEPDEQLMSDILDMFSYRLSCFEEIAAFDGYSNKDKGELALRRGMSLVKLGLKFIDVNDLLSDKD